MTDEEKIAHNIGVLAVAVANISVMMSELSDLPRKRKEMLNDITVSIAENIWECGDG